MKLAILFWFYKDPGLCENRLQILRKYNPHIKIFGLYGGEPEKAEDFESVLGKYLDDFYVFTENRDARWKWKHGDLMIAQWHLERGQRLSWDTLFIAQWDMLVIGAVEKLFPTLKKEELLLSGLRPVNQVANWWSWLRKDSSQEEEYYDFLKYVEAQYGYGGEPYCCQFIVVCLPRRFLDRYARIDNPELGFLEYKIPIYAQVFGIPFSNNHPYEPWWADDPATRNVSLSKKILNADCDEIPLRIVAKHLFASGGGRIFHPCRRIYPTNLISRIRCLSKEILQEEIKPRWWRYQRRISGC